MNKIQPGKREDLIIKKMGEETVLYDEAANQVHSLNATAGLIWDLCNGQRDVGDIAGELCARFNIGE